MKITLLCGSVEPGRDGVGDYVRQFARVLTTRGHACQIIALADRFVDQPVTTLDAQSGFDLVRLPVSYWQRTQIELAIGHLERFAPDWATLQMVSYGFEAQGLLWRSAARFALLRAAPRRHLMFHELWIGASHDSSPKDRLVGLLQRRLLVRAMRVWSPRIIHTSNTFFREMLQRINVHAEVLPLPGNIPICTLTSAQARLRMKERISSVGGVKAEPLFAGIFGTIHSECADSKWLDQVSGLAAQMGRRLVVVQFGRCGPTGQSALGALRDRARGRFDVLELGEMTALEVSTVLLGLDFGIATTPWALIGKSGAAASMLEHGVPVLVPREGAPLLRGGATPSPASHPLLLRLGDFCKALESGTLRRAQPRPNSAIYDSFISALERSW